jgi:hypothetical protein
MSWALSCTLYSLDLFTVLYKNEVHTSQKTYYIYTTMTKGLTLFRKTIALYCKNDTKITDILCGQYEELKEALKKVVHMVITGFKRSMSESSYVYWSQLKL